MLDLSKRLEEILTGEGSKLRLQEPMKEHTTFRIGGPASYYVCPSGEEELRQVLGLCKEQQVPWTVLGNGSNLLVSDRGFEGVVISMSESWSFCRIEGERLVAGGGELLSRAARYAAADSLEGMEFAAGIPGTVGGALVMNAGAYGSEIRDILEWARVMTPEGDILVLNAEELELSYRRSCIPEKGYGVLEASFTLKKGRREAILDRIRQLAAQRREKQPLEYPSAGSTFKRPEGYFAGKLIQDAGLKGLRVGGAQVSEKHSGFVINTGAATAEDVMELCRIVRERVKEQFGVELEMEVKKLGEF